MSATEELRRLLDERGVEWSNIRNDGSESDYLTEWFENNQGKAIAIEWAVGSGLAVEIYCCHLTPEQAIAAWNTRAETKAERDLRDEVNWLHAELHGAELEAARAGRTCRIDVIETSSENDEGAYYYQCTVCDETFSRRISDPFFPADFNYCPNCGAKVVE